MDIISVPAEFNKEKMDSRFRIVILAIQRARQLMRGAKPVISTNYTKESTIALEELMESSIDYVTGKEARTALLEAVTPKVSKGMKEEGEGEEDNIKKELEKDLGVYMSESENSVKTETMD